MKKQFRWIWYAIWGLVCLVGGGGTLFSWMPRTPAMFCGGCAMLVLAVVLGVWLLLLAKGKPFQKAWLPGVIAGAVYAGILAAIVYLCDVVIFADSIKDYQPVHSSLIVVILNIVLTLALIVFMPKKYDPKLTILKRGIALVLCGVALALGGLPQNYWWSCHNATVQSEKRVTAPGGFSSWTEPDFGLVEDADFYVAVDGSDENDGSFAHPFATIERARDAVRAMDKTGKSGITVAIKAGEYRISNLTFTAQDSGTAECPITYCAYGDGEVILNAGVTLKPDDFETVSGDAASRLQENVREQVICVDLSKLGITLEQLGAMHPLGSYTTDANYDGYTDGYNCELFVDDVRQTIARYPNEGWIYTGELVALGESYEVNGQKVENWSELRNPKGDTYALDAALAERIRSWATLEDVWMLGYFSTDWCYETSPIDEVNYDDLTIRNKFVARYGADGNAPYYFYNVLEELDAPGEWYLDRGNGILYLYQPENLENTRITLSLSTEVAIKVENADYLTFRGFTVECVRNHILQITGDHNAVEYCLLHNAAGDGLQVLGYHNLVANNEITQVVGSAVKVDGGDLETLTPGNNRVYNNYIHHWTGGNGASGISVKGVGHLVDHNELHDSVGSAIEYRGNDIVIEYNLIYDMSQEESDCGAIYCGKSWVHQGTIIRYNAIYNMGLLGYSNPNGIYLDDAQIGQQVYGNLLVNIPKHGILVGGGRDHNIWGNVVISTGDSGISYDQRTFESDYYRTTAWQQLQESAWQSDIWKEAYPYLSGLHMDDHNASDPMYVLNPANSRVNGNLFVNWNGQLGTIASKPSKYSDFTGNAIYTLDMLEKIFVDPNNGDYRLREDSVVYELIPDFEQLPIEKMGRE